MNLEQEWNALIQSAEVFYIYGAGQYGRELFKLISRSGKETTVKAFLVSKKEGNPDEICGIQVIEANNALDRTIPILVAVGDTYQEPVLEHIKDIGFKNIHIAVKYIFLNREYNSEVDVVSISELLKQQFVHGEFMRYDLAVRLLAIDCYYEKNDYGADFDKRMAVALNRNPYAGFADYSESRFVKLIESWHQQGYDTDSEILVSPDLRLLDGSHRLALAIYHGLSFIKIRKVHQITVYNYGEQFFKKVFSVEEFAIIDKRMTKVFHEYKHLEYSAAHIKEEALMLLGKNQPFGKRFYQSLPQLGICGQRPTAERMILYGLHEMASGKDVLDIGCNVGFFDITLAQYAQHIDGIEYNDIFVQVANRMKKRLQIDNVDFMQKDFNEFDTEKKYNLIVSFAVHRWIAMPPKTYAKKISSYIQKGGHLIFESQDMPADKDLFEDYCREFESAGFKMIKCDEICDDNINSRQYRIYVYE